MSFPPEECFSPTRDKRDPSSEAAKTEQQPQGEPGHQPQEPPIRGTEKPPEKVKRFQISPVVENKPIVANQIPMASSMADKRDSSTSTATSPATPAYVETKAKLEKLEITRPMTMPAAGTLTTTLSPGAEQPKTAPVMSSSAHSQVSPCSTIGAVTSPETNGAASSHHPLTIGSDVSDLEANLAMVFNTKIPAPSLPSTAPTQPASNVPGIVPLDVGVNTEQTGAVGGLSVLQQPPACLHHVEISSEQLAPASEADPFTSSTVHSTKSLEDGPGEPVKQSTPLATPDKPFEAAAVASTGGLHSRFAVKRVEDSSVASGPTVTQLVPASVEEPELTAINMSSR